MQAEIPKLKAKKSLGQHFLRSDAALNSMLESVENKGARRPVFEIGPGEGVLTEKLLSSGYNVCAIELDDRAVDLLNNKFTKYIEGNTFRILHTDCLEIDYKKELALLDKENKNYTLVGNIPYYITGAIFRHTFEQALLPEHAIFLVQKEVAQRVVANDKKESILSVSIKIYGAVKNLMVVKAGSFSPPPKVDSAILEISNIENPFKSKKQEELFFQIMKAAFKQKRKFAISNLKNNLDENIFNFAKNFFQEKERAEDVAIEKWKDMIMHLSTK